MGGEFTYPKMGYDWFDPQPYATSRIKFSICGLRNYLHKASQHRPPRNAYVRRSSSGSQTPTQPLTNVDTKMWTIPAISSGDIPNSTTPSQNPRGTPRNHPYRRCCCKAKLRVTAQSRPDRGPTAQSGPDRGPTVQSGPDRPVVQPQPPIL